MIFLKLTLKLLRYVYMYNSTVHDTYIAADHALFAAILTLQIMYNTCHTVQIHVLIVPRRLMLWFVRTVM